MSAALPLNMSGLFCAMANGVLRAVEFAMSRAPDFASPFEQLSLIHI